VHPPGYAMPEWRSVTSVLPLQSSLTIQSRLVPLYGRQTTKEFLDSAATKKKFNAGALISAAITIQLRTRTFAFERSEWWTHSLLRVHHKRQIELHSRQNPIQSNSFLSLRSRANILLASQFAMATPQH